MDHPAHLSSIRPWRSAALLAAAIAVAELVLLVVAAVAIFAEPFAGKVEEKAKATVAEAIAEPAAEPLRTGRPGAEPPAVAQLSRRETSVLVLNGNGRSGAASSAAEVVRALDYLVAGAGNAPRTNFPRTLVMYRPGFRGEAERLARDVHVKRVTPLDGMKPADLMGAQLALILGER